MAFFFRQQPYSSNGMRLTGFARYTEVLERNFKKYFFTNLLTLVGFLPFFAGCAYAALSKSLLVLIVSGIIGGIFAGPALSCMYDAVLRGLRDVPPKPWADYKHALRQNWRQSILPGILFCLFVGFDLFMVLLFSWSSSFPGWGTIALYLFSVLIIAMWFSIAWPQIVLFDQTFFQTTKNCLLFTLRFLPKVFGAATLQAAYWAVFVVLLPYSVFLFFLLGFWFILYTANFLLYNTLDSGFQIEEKISAAFPEQAPFYEDDETWLKKRAKQ